MEPVPVSINPLTLAKERLMNDEAEPVPTLTLQAATPDSSGLPFVALGSLSSGLYRSNPTQRNSVTSDTDPSGDECFDSVPRSALSSVSTEGPESPSDSVLSESNRTSRILTAVEFYFSDEHVAKDAFMYRHIMRGKNGFVNMKLVASFRKVKNITKDWTVVREAVKTSTILQLNPEGTKVKRCIPFSSNINPLAKCILVYNLGPKPSMGAVEQHLEQHGRICKISLFVAGQAVPNEVRAQRTRLEIPQSEPLAVVEFSTAEEARKIVTDLDANPSKAGGIQVSLLNLKRADPSPNSSLRLDSNSASDIETSSLDPTSSISSKEAMSDGSDSGKPAPETSPTSSRRRKKKNKLKSPVSDDTGCLSDTGAGEETPYKSHRRRSNSDSLQHLREGRLNWRSDPFSQPSQGRVSVKCKSFETGLSNNTSPQLGRRHRPQTQHKHNLHSMSPGSSTSSSLKSLSIDGVIRQPFGPSGVGFAARRETGAVS